MDRNETESPVALDVSGGVAAVTLNRPGRRNALDAQMVDAIGAAFDAAEADASVRAIVVAGAGGAFCAGAVLDTLLASADGAFGEVAHVYDGFLRVLRSPLPTIAAVDGAAVGAGLNLALACDVRIASPRARFDSRFPALRLHPGGGHTWLLGRAVGRQRATLMALFGETLDANGALAAGLIAEIHPAEDLPRAAFDLAARLAEMDRPLVERMIDSLRAAEQTLSHAEMLELETERQRWSTQQDDFVRRTAELWDRISRGRS